MNEVGIDVWVSTIGVQPSAWDLLCQRHSRIQNLDYYLESLEELCTRRLAEDFFFVSAVNSVAQSGVPAFAQVPRETTA